MRRKSKIGFAKKPKSRKNVLHNSQGDFQWDPQRKTLIEIVHFCDKCRTKLPVSRSRTGGSAVCAAGNGESVGTFVDAFGKKSPHYFCSPECKDAFAEDQRPKEKEEVNATEDKKLSMDPFLASPPALPSSNLR